MATTKVRYNALLALKAYELSREGHTEYEIAQAIGIGVSTFQKWKNTNQEFSTFLQRGREAQPTNLAKTAEEKVYRKLSPEVRKIWDRLCAIAHTDNAEERLEVLQGNLTDAHRQQLYIHVLATSGSAFDEVKARKMAGISFATLKRWKETDTDFLLLLTEIDEIKKDFIETAFLKKIEEGDSACIIHGTKTKLRDRGYGEVKQVEMAGKVSHTHQDFPMEKVLARMSLTARREFLDALAFVEGEGDRIGLLPPPTSNVVDAEVIG